MYRILNDNEGKSVQTNEGSTYSAISNQVYFPSAWAPDHKG